MIIYKVTHEETGKCYVGQTVRTLEVRKAEHLQASANILRSVYPAPLHVALSLHGKLAFTWGILEVCVSYEQMNERERFYIKLLDTLTPNGFNQTVGGHMNGDLSEEIRDKISESMVKVHADPAYQARNYPKLKGLVPPNKGVPMSDVQKAKVSAAKKAVYADPAYVNPNLGQKRTGEALDNLRAAFETRELPTGEAWQKAHSAQYTDEVRAKMRAAKLGKKPSTTKRVVCIETGEVFNGLTEAAKALDINRQSIWMQIKGKLKSAGGKHFRYEE